MSFIQSQIKCANCGREMNIATGTFGYGSPKKCPNCDSENLQFMRHGWKVRCVKCETEYQGGEFAVNCPHKPITQYDCGICGNAFEPQVDPVSHELSKYLFRCVTSGCQGQDMYISIG